MAATGPVTPLPMTGAAPLRRPFVRAILRRHAEGALTHLLPLLLTSQRSAIAAARVLRSVLYGVAPADPVSIGAVVVVLSGFACYLPARRAASLDPITALRHE